MWPPFCNGRVLLCEWCNFLPNTYPDHLSSVNQRGVYVYFAGNVRYWYPDAVDISSLEPTVDFKSTTKYGTARAGLRAVMKSLQSWGKRRAPICSRAAGKKRKRLFAL